MLEFYSCVYEIGLVGKFQKLLPIEDLSKYKLTD